MKRILVTEGDGESVRRVARKYTASVRIYAETEYCRKPDLELLVTPDGQWELVQGGKSVAQGLLAS